MDIKVPASELNRMMKTIVQCIDQKGTCNLSNIEVTHANNLLTIRGTNSIVSAVMSTPLLGESGKGFCVDGMMFARVCSMCSGDITIITDGKTCTVKGAGRTRIPIVNAEIPAYEEVNGKTFTAVDVFLSSTYNSVAFALSTDQSRVIFTGVLTEIGADGILHMRALDGFRMAVENMMTDCHEEISVIIPGPFMKLLTSCTAYADDSVQFVTDGKRIQASTPDMKLCIPLLSGAFPDKNAIVPKKFATEVLVNAEQLRNALKCGSVVNNKNNLVKLEIAGDKVTVTSNSEEADFDAEVPCEIHGPALNIAFNHKYLMETINSISADEIILKFNMSHNPCIICSKDSGGFRLLLPVRIAG